MRTVRAIVLVAVVILASVLAWAPGVSAQEPRTSVVDVALVTEEATHLFTVGWEQGELDITLLAPDGTRIPQDTPPPGTRVAMSDRITIFRVDRAQPGLWRAELKEFNNGRIGFITQKLVLPLLVQDVVAEQQGTDILVEFRLEGETSASCDYTVYLALDAQAEARNGKVLQRGQATTGERVRVRCPAAGISSYPAYIVTVYAESTSGGFTDFHYASSAPFAFTDSQAPGPVRELLATVLAGGVRASWQPPEGTRPEGYLVYLQDADGKILHAVTIGGESRAVTVPIAVEGTVTLNVSARAGGGYGTPAKIAIDSSRTLSQLVGLELPEHPRPVGGQVELTYDTRGVAVPLQVQVDENRKELTINGKGVLRVAVRNGVNRVRIAARADDGVWVEQTRRWMIDLTPPTLRIFEDWDGLSTGSESLVLAGWVEAGAVVSINGLKVPVKADGVFAKSVGLARGQNLLWVAAQDKSGNVTTYQARVVREDSGRGPWWWVWLGVSIAVVAAGASLLFVWRARRGFRSAVSIAALAVVLLGLAGVATGAVMLAGREAGRASTVEPQLTALDKEALVALAGGDFQAAYRLANQASLSEPGRPITWLLAARAALLQGDLPAAGFYYDRLSSLSAEERGDWGLEEAGPELDRWSNVEQLAGKERREAAGRLAEDVRSALERDQEQAAAEDREVAELLADREALEELEAEVDRLGEGTSEAQLSTLDGRLEDLLDRPGAERARSLRIRLLAQTGEWRSLVRWLSNDGAAGLVDLAELLASGTLPVEALGGMPEASLNATSEEFVERLAENLEEAGGDPGDGPAPLHLALAGLYASGYLHDAARALEIVMDDVGLASPASAEEIAAFRRLQSLRLLLESVDEDRREQVLLDWLGGDGGLEEESGGSSETTVTSGTTVTSQGSTSTDSVETTTSTTESLPEGLSGHNVRTDLTPFYNICAPEMTQRNRIRFYVTMAEGSGGYPEGEPQPGDFAFRTDVGFRRLLTVNSMTSVDQVERYTMLLIDRRPTMTGSALSLAQAAALAYVRTMPEGEKVLVYAGGLPPGYRYAFPEEKTELFGNPEMETFLFSDDKASLERFIRGSFAGDAFDNPDMEHMVSWALNQMTAISPQGVSGAWDSFALGGATPRFGQVIVFTNGDPGQGVIAGGDKGLEYVRGGAIAANAAVHVVAVEPVVPLAQLAALAEAGRGSCIDPSVDDLASSYRFVRERQVKVFLADCAFPEYPVNDFFELRAQHTPTGVIVGFQRNPGKGVDLVGTLHYSDASLSEADFSDYTGGETDGTSGGGNPFEEDGTEDTTGGGGTSGEGTGGEEGLGGQTSDDTVTDWPGESTLRVDGLDRHAIARGEGGLLLVNLLGQGFSGLSPSEVRITFPGLGTIASAYLDIQNDTTIRFFLPVTMRSGMYSLSVTIRGSNFFFPDTLWIYDTDSFTTITFGEWTITAASAQPAQGGGWVLSGATINDYLHLQGSTQLSGDWLDAGVDELTLTPRGEAYIAFDPESDDSFVQELFLEEGADLMLGRWQEFSLTRSGDPVPFYAWQLLNTAVDTISLGLIEMPFDTGTLYTDKVEVPIVRVNLDLPLQEYVLMYNGLLPCSATAEATFTADIDSLDLALEAGLEVDDDEERGLRFMGALRISELGFELNTAEKRIAVDLGVKLVGDDGFKAHLALKDTLLDEILITIETEIPVTQTPIPVKITELGGGVENLSAMFSGNPVQMLGTTIVGLAKLEAGKATDVLPFLSGPAFSSWLDEDDIPPLLATDNTSLKLRPWPFSLAFSTDVKLFDEFPIGHAELSIGYYNFQQALLGISDEEAVGLHASLAVGPDLDLHLLRLKYQAGPSLDINEHGFFLASNGSAWLGLNLGPLDLTMGANGTFLVAVHDIPDSSWPQLSFVIHAAPSVGIPGLWAANEVKDVRLLINENGFRLVGIPSPLDMALDWLGDQLEAAANATWEAVTQAMEDLAELGELTWDLVGDGLETAGETIDDAVDAITNGAGLVLDTAQEVVDQANNLVNQAVSTGQNLANEGVNIVVSGWNSLNSLWSGH